MTENMEAPLVRGISGLMDFMASSGLWTELELASTGLTCRRWFYTAIRIS